MSRSRKLIGLVATLVVLIFASYLIKNMDSEVEDTPVEDTSVIVVELDTSKLESLTWEREDESITLIQEEGIWSLESDSSFPVNSTYTDAMCEVLELIKATYTIEAVEDVSEYGLDEPVITIKAQGEAEVNISIGTKTAANGSKYISIGDGNVYLVDASVLSVFDYSLYDIVKMEAIPSMTDIVDFTISRGDNTLSLIYNDDGDLAYSAEYVWFLKDGDEYTTLDTDTAGDLIGLVTSLSWTECVEHSATDEELSQYGLDVPATTVTVNYIVTTSVSTNETDDEGDVIYEDVEEVKQFELHIGKQIDGVTYAKLADSSMIYKILNSTAEKMLYTTVEEMRPDEVLYMDWDLVDSVDITLDGVTHHIEKQVKEETDDDGNVTEETVYILGDEEVDILEFYESLTSLTSSGSVENIAGVYDEEISFVFNRSTDTYKQVELIFYQYNSTSCLVSLNGEERLLIARSDVATVIEEFSQFIS